MKTFRVKMYLPPQPFSGVVTVEARNETESVSKTIKVAHNELVERTSVCRTEHCWFDAEIHFFENEIDRESIEVEEAV